MNLEYVLCKELGQLEEKYRGGGEMSEGDLRRIDLLAHSIKCLATYTAMKSAEDEQNMSYMNGNSYDINHPNNMSNNSYMNNSYRGPMNRYMSSDMNDMSGHYPPMYPQDRRW